MTNPNLSIEVSDCSKTKNSIGRVYQFPHTSFPKKIRYAEAAELLACNQVFPSITNIISAKAIDLSGWAKWMMGNYIRQNINSGAPINEIIKEAQGANDRYTKMACDKGSEVHQAAEDYILLGKTDHDFKFGGDPYYQSFLNFIDEYQPEFLSIETTVYGKTKDNLYYGGTIDFIARINGKVFAGDWKTSKKLHSEVGIQLAAGINAKKRVSEDGESLEDMIHIDGAIGVHLTPEGYNVSLVDDLDYCWETFQALRKVWEWNAFSGDFRKKQLKEVKSPIDL